MTKMEDVIEGCRKGDARMQRELYDRYSPRFYALCRRYTSSDETAQDVLVEGFTVIFQSIGGYRGEGSFEGWMRTIMMRSIVKQYRQDKRCLEEPLDITMLADRVLSPDTDAQIDVRQALVESMRLLSPPERLVFNMIVVEEYSFSEVAEKLDMPSSTVKSQFYRARDKMRVLMRNRLGRPYVT